MPPLHLDPSSSSLGHAGSPRSRGLCIFSPCSCLFPGRNSNRTSPGGDRDISPGRSSLLWLLSSAPGAVCLELPNANHISHPPGWLSPSAVAFACFLLPSSFCNALGSWGGAGSPSWFHLPLIRPCGAFGVHNPPNEVPAPCVLRLALGTETTALPQPSIPFPRNAGD